MSSRLLHIDIPEFWEIKKLKELSYIIMGQSPPSSTYNSISNGLPFFQGNADFGYFYPNVNVWCNSPKKVAKPNDILVSVRAPVGAINIANVGSCIGRGLSAVRINNGYDMKYLYYYLNHFNKIFRLLQQGSTFEAITKEELINFPVLLPQNLNEQKKISSLLYNVDGLILNTQKIIEYLQILKKGLMQRFFTEGIGHAEFKETKWGKIPKSWDICKLNKICEINPSYETPEQKDYLFLEMESIDENSYKPKYWLRKPKEKLTNTKFKSRDILFAKITPCVENGKGAYIQHLDEEIAFGSTELVVLKPNKNIDPLFLYYLTKTSTFRHSAISLMEGATGRQRVPSYFFKTHNISLPPFKEQQIIVKILFNLDNKIENEQKYFNKLKIIKKGLMQDLLTGKKRVKLN